MRKFFVCVAIIISCTPAMAILDCDYVTVREDAPDGYVGSELLYCSQCNYGGCRFLNCYSYDSDSELGDIRSDGPDPDKYLCTNRGWLRYEGMCLDGNTERIVGASCTSTRTMQICSDNTIAATCSGPSIGTAVQTSTGRYKTELPSGACQCANMSAWTTTSRTCNAGYYLSGTSCVSCAATTGNTAATSNAGATSAGGCFLPSGSSASDNTGKYTVIGNCYYSL